VLNQKYKWILVVFSRNKIILGSREKVISMDIRGLQELICLIKSNNYLWNKKKLAINKINLNFLLLNSLSNLNFQE